MKRIICFFLGHYTSVAKLRPGEIYGFGGFFHSSYDNKGVRPSCLRCHKLLPSGYRKTKYV